MASSAAYLARLLARDAEAVCRHYLPNGRRSGGYWVVGSVANDPGRSLYVRLVGPETGRRAAGKWTDAATGEHGDLLDLIAARCALTGFGETADEVGRFLALPRSEPDFRGAPRFIAPSADKVEAARRLVAMARPIAGTLVEIYLGTRGIPLLPDLDSLRFHPRCYYRPDKGPTETWPAMIAAVTDFEGRVAGAHRTWLDRSGLDKAPIETPRRALGDLLGNGVRFGVAADVMAAGEGIETMLSLRVVMPTMPMAAALSAAHLGGILLPPGLRRLYIARDDDSAGDGAVAALTERAGVDGVEAIALTPQRGDFNEDLRKLGARALATKVRQQLAPEDAARFLVLSD